MDLMLKGVKVLDFTNNTAGPCTVQLMAERGAETIKIEKPVIGDDCRFFVPQYEGVSTAHMWANRNKKSVVLNLKDPRAKTAIYELVKDADVLVESYRPGVMDKLGFGYETLKEINPKLIYCSVSGFGSKGLYKDRGGYDIIAQGFSGVIDVTGEPGTRHAPIGFHIGDTVSAINAFGSIMMALYYRSWSGKGQHIDVALARTLVWNAETYNGYTTGQHLKRMGRYNPAFWPFGIFEGNDGESLIVACLNNSLWKRLCTAMGKEELGTDPRYDSNMTRVKNQEEITVILETWIKEQKNAKEAEKILNQYGIPCTKVNGQEDVIADPHVQEQGWLKEIPVPESVHSIGHILGGVGLADFSEGEVLNNAAPDLGQHNQEILQKCGFSAEEIDQMESEWASGK